MASMEIQSILISIILAIMIPKGVLRNVLHSLLLGQDMMAMQTKP